MRRALLALLLLAAPAAAQKVTLPAEVKGDPVDFVLVKSDTDCSSLRWVVIDQGLKLFPPDQLKDTRTAVVVATKAGRYRLLAYGEAGGLTKRGIPGQTWVGLVTRSGYNERAAWCYQHRSGSNHSLPDSEERSMAESYSSDGQPCVNALEDRRTVHGNGFKDISGQRFGRVLVLCYSHTKGKIAYWHCRCDCGKAWVVRGHNLRRGGTTSCGCLNRERITKHGMSRGSREYDAWCLMKSRCNSQKHVSYANYGGRGIKVCEEWSEFLRFLEDVGPAPSQHHELDRIDNDGDYERGNVRWATRKQQSRNKRTTRLITYEGETLCVQDWSNRFAVADSTLRQWLNRYGVEGAFARCRARSCL